MIILFLLFQNIIDAVEINARVLSPNPSTLLNASSRVRSPLAVDSQDLATASLSSFSSLRPVSSSSFRKTSETAFEEALLVFKKLRPSPKSVRPAPAAATSSAEDPPPLLTHEDEEMVALTRWPSHFVDASLGRVDGQLLLARLKIQIIDACKRCQEACKNTRKVTKEMARRMQQHLRAVGDSNMSLTPEDAEVFGEAASVASSATKESANDLQTNLQEPPIEQLEEIGCTLRKNCF